MSQTPAAGKNSAQIRAAEILVALLLSLFWIGVQWLPLKGVPQKAEDAPGFDAHIYVAMAESPATFTMAPFGYRIGVPFLAQALPIPLETAFKALCAIGLLLTLFLAYFFFLELGFSHLLSLLGVSFLGAAPQIPIYLQNYFLVDPLALAAVVGLLVLVERGKATGATAFLLLIASLCKESAFYVVPVLYLRLSEGRLVDLKAARRTLLVCLPAIAAALILRFGWADDAPLFPYLSPLAIAQRPWFGSAEVYRDLWKYSFAYLSVLALINAASASWRDFTRRYAPYLALVLIQLLVATDTRRLLFFGFPVIIPLALAEFQRIREALPGWFPLLTSGLVFCYLFLPDRPLVALGLIILARVLEERRGRR